MSQICDRDRVSTHSDDENTRGETPLTDGGQAGQDQYRTSTIDRDDRVTAEPITEMVAAGLGLSILSRWAVSPRLEAARSSECSAAPTDCRSSGTHGCERAPRTTASRSERRNCSPTGSGEPSESDDDLGSGTAKPRWRSRFVWVVPRHPYRHLPVPPGTGPVTRPQIGRHRVPRSRDPDMNRGHERSDDRNSTGAVVRSQRPRPRSAITRFEHARHSPLSASASGRPLENARWRDDLTKPVFSTRPGSVRRLWLHPTISRALRAPRQDQQQRLRREDVRPTQQRRYRPNREPGHLQDGLRRLHEVGEGPPAHRPPSQHRPRARSDALMTKTFPTHRPQRRPRIQ